MPYTILASAIPVPIMHTGRADMPRTILQFAQKVDFVHLKPTYNRCFEQDKSKPDPLYP